MVLCIALSGAFWAGNFKYLFCFLWLKEVVVLSKVKVEVKPEKFRLRKPLFDKLDNKKFFEEYSKGMGRLKAEYDFRREIWHEELPLKVLKRIVIGVLFGLFVLFTVYVVQLLWIKLF